MYHPSPAPLAAWRHFQRRLSKEKVGREEFPNGFWLQPRLFGRGLTLEFVGPLSRAAERLGVRLTLTVEGYTDPEGVP